MTTPLGTLDVTSRGTRHVSVSRRTRETEIDVSLGLDGSGVARISTGVGFYDHLLTSLAHHGLFDIEVRATGDLEVDEHHTVEDVALVLGSAFAEALGDRAGIRRFGEASVPMDESLATAAIDVGGRPYAVIDLPFRGERVGGLPLQLVEHALEAFARTAGATLHVRGGVAVAELAEAAGGAEEALAAVVVEGGAFEGLVDAGDDVAGVVDGGVGEEDGEFVAADAGEDVGGADYVADQFGETD